MKTLFRSILLALAVAIATPALGANTCFVTEFRVIPPPAYQAAVQQPLAEQTIAVSGTSAQSAAFQPNTQLVRITCDVSVSIEFGTNPTATTSTALLPSGLIEYYLVPGGQSFKVAVISNS